MTLAAFLRDMGLAPASKPTTRPAGQPSDWAGIWYHDGQIPH